MTGLLLGAGQAEAVPGDLRANVATAARLARRAADRGVRVLVLPEAFLTGYDASAFDGVLPTAERVAGPELDPLREAAATGDLVVVVGTALQRADRRTLSSVVVRPGGEVSVPYDKQHVDHDELAWFTAGDAGCSITVDGVELGLSICYDGCFPEHARAASDDGALGYLSSAAYFPGGAHRRDLYYAARAVENSFYVVFSGLTGRCGGSSFIGGSAIHDPEGRPLERLGEEEGIAVGELDPGVVAATRERHRMHHDHRRSLGDRVRA
ncbi:carbon-nitrogen hydrolase family protein [Nocardioides sp. Arc9.136]|uniref:carbon-nitrogen hydrolase family protein n=1 Tax=Nocardioides sp. Arc9.136 TaxID=2996826 RepID=UPI0026651B91|nr:carbon-nitrogen hydrolase family protein [Nocardioides sp. Arc9.136]WKN47806.1 carbon-nitrogen hydrolase family protein [Nocardioides sp. Arc9.136]